MDALEFARELKRMCDAHWDNAIVGCSKCPGYESRGCSIRNLEKLLPIVEKWSAEHPKVRNVDHVVELLEKAGYEVDEEELVHRCIPKMDNRFNRSPHIACEQGDCVNCYNWWLEEYKGEENE